ncbi:type II secretion system major pseudopilin GspG [Pseudidiomarina terrestris]|uniref:Type II secretion system core protein G n=1 Tax=Pseudidiomarina terrestris TaxID=2820060 RepID=A0AAW7QW46_9GAMM|nr:MULTISPECIES: type II secretion system major pseudopilin GspG [unclassified Pseudidiomarina]MDN7124460.1 type II secretion system major pseudopilin GspG [Pseudidiomarina sp. 1APP75-32.1]MDN7129249.1 type II secretion system major pseudopilin GspG [Pseudidiomarina sp. 1APR75-15]MDN7134485.1 type II secretion system major pseudopilin GspG [Pseudidiomarina sp. 1ASP75-5]MEA3587720.1 type II secretion system major pseudopilin GspG [Pseudidiomarina sp. 1APP75-27a]
MKACAQVARQRGFTLIELLIVIVILGLLASLVAPQMFGKVDSSKIKTAETQMKMLETSLSTYRLDMGRYPESLDDLLKGDEPNWQGPYFPKDVPPDPWGNDYVYRMPGDDGAPFTLLSYGADGREGGEENNADIYLQ